MVVPVLMTRCQLFDHPNSGPLAAHCTTTATAEVSPFPLPTHSVTGAAATSAVPPPLRPGTCAGPTRC